MKAKAHDAYITSIAEKPNGIRIQMYERAQVLPEKIPDLIRMYGRRLRFVPDKVPYFVYTAKEGEGLLSQLDYVIDDISRIKTSKGGKDEA